MGVCIKCNECKSDDLFESKNVCKVCASIRRSKTNKNRYERNKEKYREEAREKQRKFKKENPELWRERCDKNNSQLKEQRRMNASEKVIVTAEEKKQKYEEYHKKYREEHKAELKERNKKYRKENKAELKKKKSEYYQSTKEQSREKRRQWQRQHLSSNPYAKFVSILRTNIYLAITRCSKNGKTKSCAGYGIDVNKIYERIGPRPGDNYHLDHIIPVSFFDLDNSEHVRMAHVPENLRWITQEENLTKYNNIMLELIYASEVLTAIYEQVNSEINKSIHKDLKEFS